MIKGHVYKGKPKPLTKAQRKLLVTTKWVDLQKVFKGPGWTQKWLQAEQRKAREEFAEQHTVDQEIVERQIRRAAKNTQKLYEESLARNEQFAEELRIAKMLRHARPVKPIPPPRGKSEKSMVPIVIASDWHADEIVIPAKVRGLNEYNREIFLARSGAFFSHTITLTDLFRHIRKIDTLVLALLGDFITGSIHEENRGDTWCPPVEAMGFVQGVLIGGIEKLLRDGGFLRIVVLCSVGNHARITKKPFHQREVENSLETFAYAAIARHFAGDPRVEVIMPDAYMSHFEIMGKTVAYHHGHGVQGGSGVGGVAVPLLRSAGKHDRTRRADLYINGHFHVSQDLNGVVSNGSLIGYNAYAMRNGLPFERPQQSMVLLDSSGRRGPVLPIWVDE